MLHQLTIPYGMSPDHPLDDQIHVMASMDVGSIDDERYPDSVTGSIIDAPRKLIDQVGAGVPVFADLAGKTYRFVRLSANGAFELHKTQTP